ncbi:MAG: hypothetical protein J5556_06775, partial [Deltaproteobacteria bacterium]|nr:hypothetical protein [Deltaproteobacteria bacterium]
YVEMIGCGLSNDGYAELQDKHPGIRILWEIRYATRVLRTDAVGWSTIAAEALVMCISLSSARKVAGLCRWVATDAVSMFAGCALVFFLCRWIKGLGHGPAVTVALCLAVCGAAYTLVLLLGRNTLALEGIKKVRSRFSGA